MAMLAQEAEYNFALVQAGAVWDPKQIVESRDDCRPRDGKSVEEKWVPPSQRTVCLPD